jgi:hypothetical protein
MTFVYCLTCRLYGSESISGEGRLMEISTVAVKGQGTREHIMIIVGFPLRLLPERLLPSEVVEVHQPGVSYVAGRPAISFDKASMS